MPIPRRVSEPAIQGQSSSFIAQESGVYRAANLHELDEAFEDENDELQEVHDELEEVFDDDEFEDNFPDVPSLMPGVHSDALMAAPLSFSRAQEPVPVFEMELDTPRAPPALLFRSSSTSNMAAVRPALAVAPAAPSESSLFDSFDADESLDIPLDLKGPPTSHSVITTIAGLEITAPAGSVAGSAPLSVSSTQKAVDPRPGIVAFAGFGIPPEKIGGTPTYALRVLARKWTLRDDLRVARLRRIQDVTLYEAALGCADESAVTKGVAIIAASVIGTISTIVAAAAFLL